MHVRHPIIFGPHVLEKPFAEKFLPDGPFDIHFGAIADVFSLDRNIRGTIDTYRVGSIKFGDHEIADFGLKLD